MVGIPVNLEKTEFLTLTEDIPDIQYGLV